MVSYVLMIRERLEKLGQIVRENLTNAQATQKKWYDRHARSREFKPEDQVLILLPTSTNKVAERRGPYPVVWRVSDFNYEVRVTDSRRRKFIFHVNMLRQWHPPSTVSFLTEEVPDGVSDEVDDLVLWDGTEEDCDHPVINAQLKPAQRSSLDELLKEFADVLNSRPGKTHVTQCRINTGTAMPIRLMPYQLTHVYRHNKSRVGKDGGGWNN